MQYHQRGFVGGFGETEPVSRIMYASRSLVRGPVYAEMERIRAAAMRHNEPLHVCTALLYQSGWFLQWKEGPPAAVLKIMDRVAADARHASLRIVHSSRGPRLLAGPWSMAIVQCDETPDDMARRVAAVRHRFEEGDQFAPPAVWRQLSTPMRHPGADRQAQPDAFQRVLVCGAAGDAAFDLVKWLGRHYGQEVVHRRFAGPYELDVGTDYTDFEDHGRVMRVIAMARRGLALPLTRAFLPDYSPVVLMLSGDLQRDVALFDRVAEACRQLPAPPRLLGVGLSHDSHLRLNLAANRAGLDYAAAVVDAGGHAACWQAVDSLLAEWESVPQSAAG
jgi:hypothetical protein